MPSTDELREVIRGRLRRVLVDTPVERIAESSGVSDATIYAFTAEGSTLRPYRQTLVKLRETLDTLERTPVDQRADQAPGVPTVAIPLHELTYWRGIIESEHRHLNGVSKSLEALLGMLNDATRGIGGFLQTDVLPTAGAPAVSREELAAARRAMSEARDQAAAYAARIRELGAPLPDTTTPPQRKAGGA